MPQSSLTLNIITEDSRWKPLLPKLRPTLRKALKLTLQSEGISLPQTLSLVLANNSFVQHYNKTYRHKDSPTNILSFESDEENYLGDLILAYETIKRESAEQNKEFDHHFLHLAVHGTLHLLGENHIAAEDAERMEKKEISILSQLAIENPYE